MLELLNKIFKKAYPFQVEVEDSLATHERRMKRIQKKLGNLTEKELKKVEGDFLVLSDRFGFPIHEISLLFEWLYKNFPLTPQNQLFYLEKSLKMAKTLGRKNLKMERSDLDGVFNGPYQ